VSEPGYRLEDVGGAARLEQFGERLVDRPAAAALGARGDPARWAAADLRFERDRGWAGPGASAGPWPIEVAGLTLELRATEAGQVGLFPEHLAMLPWLCDEVAAQVAGGGDAPAVLHLFAYTGLATLAMASAGGAVTHLDAARPTVAWARHNAAASGLADRPIRWIVDDALAFTRREARRGRRFDLLVLDPPTWGHAASGERWELRRSLPDLLDAAAAVATAEAAILLTAHTTGLDPVDLEAALADAFGSGSISAEPLVIRARSGAELSVGIAARMIRG
jgi:23S rRNA (cytosine1962-C5)-methyltransferase